jgi:hypothetical protein
MTYSTEQKNNAVLAYMGGLNYLKDKPYVIKNTEDITLSDLKFHKSWNWLIPVWSKIRFKMTPVMVIHAVSCIDDASIDPLFDLISQIAIDWCKSNNYKL